MRLLPPWCDSEDAVGLLVACTLWGGRCLAQGVFATHHVPLKRRLCPLASGLPLSRVRSLQPHVTDCSAFPRTLQAHVPPGPAGTALLCYVTPKEHLGLPTVTMSRLVSSHTRLLPTQPTLPR